EFVDQRVGVADRGPLRVVQLRVRGAEGLEALEGERRQGIGIEVAGDDPERAIAAAQAVDEAVGKLRGLALVAEQAGLDLEDGGHGGVPHDWGPLHSMIGPGDKKAQNSGCTYR